jgi:hypothetical protein
MKDANEETAVQRTQQETPDEEEAKLPLLSSSLFRNQEPVPVGLQRVFLACFCSLVFHVPAFSGGDSLCTASCHLQSWTSKGMTKRKSIDNPEQEEKQRRRRLNE